MLKTVLNKDIVKLYSAGEHKFNFIFLFIDSKRDMILLAYGQNVKTLAVSPSYISVRISLKCFS